MKLSLHNPFSSQEINEAVWCCVGDKSHGPMGLLSKKKWDILEKDIISHVEDFALSSFIPMGCISSFIALIPKVNDPLLIDDFTPIRPI